MIKVIKQKDIAHSLRFSQSAVSCVLNNKGKKIGLSNKTISIIKSKADELGYVPDKLAQSLRLKNSNIVAALVYDLADEYCVHILRSVEDFVLKHNYNLYILDFKNDINLIENYVNIIMQMRINKVALINRYFLKKHIVDTLHESVQRVATVGIDLSKYGIYSIVLDNFSAVKCAIDYLYDLGHRNINVITDPENCYDSTKRESAFKLEMKKRGVKSGKYSIFNNVKIGYDYNAGEEAVNYWDNKNIPYSAILSLGDRQVFGAIRALTKMGLSVPDDVSVMGFDDLGIAKYYMPALTTISQPMDKMGIECGRALFLKSKPKVMKKVFKAELIIRQSAAGVKNG